MAETKPEDASGSDDAENEQKESGELEDMGDVVDGEHVSSDPDRRVQVAARFSGPLPPPGALRQYEEVMPGLSREIVDQWKGETAHRHRTIDGMRATDHDAMREFYKAELRGGDGDELEKSDS